MSDLRNQTSGGRINVRSVQGFDYNARWERLIMCVDCDEEGISRRTFLTGATTAMRLAQEETGPRWRLDLAIDLDAGGKKFSCVVDNNGTVRSVQPAQSG